MILTEHRLTITAICPVDGTIDVYKMIVETHDMIAVERIQDVVASATRDPLYQEALTQSLADELGATVTTEGVHSGVDTRCRAEPNF